MNFSLGPSGGIQDPQILRLLSELTPIVKKHGATGVETIKFIEKHADIVTVDEISQQMVTFKDIAESLSPLIQGIQIGPQKLPDDPADFWKK